MRSALLECSLLLCHKNLELNLCIRFHFLCNSGSLLVEEEFLCSGTLSFLVGGGSGRDRGLFRIVYLFLILFEGVMVVQLYIYIYIYIPRTAHI